MFLSAFSACVSEPEYLASSSDEEVPVTFLLQLPGARTPVTRALADPDENEVREVDVLVFEQSGGNYLYSARGSDISTDTDDNRKKAFTVKWNAGSMKATAPTVPPVSTLTVGPLNYDNESGKTEIDITGNYCTGEIYVFESDNHMGAKHSQAKDLLERTCIVVGGIYGTDNDTTYYCMDFSTGSGVSQAFIDVLRPLA